MATKVLTPEQCNWMHQQFPPPNCCLCNSKEEIAALEGRLRRYEKLLSIVLPHCDCGDFEHCVSCKFRAKEKDIF